MSKQIKTPIEVVRCEWSGNRANAFDTDGNNIEVQFPSDGKESVEPFYGSAKAKKRLQKGEKLNATPPLRLSNSKSKIAKANNKLGNPKPIKL